MGINGTTVHWDGQCWAIVQSATTVGLQDVWCFGPDDAWAVGGSILHWNGDDWSIVLDGKKNNVSSSSIWGYAPNEMWTVGRVGEYGSVIQRWDGNGWSRTDEVNHAVHGMSVERVRDVWGNSADNV